MTADFSYYGMYLLASIALVLAVLIACWKRWKARRFWFTGALSVLAIAPFVMNGADDAKWSPDGKHLAVVRDAVLFSDEGPEVFIRQRNELRFRHVRTGHVASGGNWRLQWVTPNRVCVTSYCDNVFELDDVRVSCSLHGGMPQAAADRTTSVLRQ